MYKGVKKVEYSKFVYDPTTRTNKAKVVKENVEYFFGMKGEEESVLDRLVMAACRTKRRQANRGYMWMRVKPTKAQAIGKSRAYMEVTISELEKLIKNHFKKSYNIVRGEQLARCLKISAFKNENKTYSTSMERWLATGDEPLYILDQIMQRMVNDEIIIEGDYLVIDPT